MRRCSWQWALLLMVKLMVLAPDAGASRLGSGIGSSRAEASSRHATHHRRRKRRAEIRANAAAATAGRASLTPWGPRYSALQPVPPAHLRNEASGIDGTVHRCHWEGLPDHLEDYLVATQLVDPDQYYYGLS